MARVVLVHWKETEWEERAAVLRAAGYDVERLPASVRMVRENPPDAFVIDLSRTPSHGSAVGVFLRQYKATRLAPLVFVEGQGEKVRRVQALLPDARYTDSWQKAVTVLESALEDPPGEVVVPAMMASYQATPIVAKLGLVEGVSVRYFGAPGDLVSAFGVKALARGPAKLVFLFAKDVAELEARFDAAAKPVMGGGSLWICWPKKASGAASDLSQPAIRKFARERGWVDFKICSIDSTWSGLRFSRKV